MLQNSATTRRTHGLQPPPTQTLFSEFIVDSIRDYSQSPYVVIFKINKQKDYFEYFYSKSTDGVDLTNHLQKIPRNGRLMGLTADEKRIIWTTDLNTETRAYKSTKIPITDAGFVGIINVPIMHHNRILGILAVSFKKKR